MGNFIGGENTSVADLLKLDNDTKLLALSYLPLDDILKIFGDNKNLRDKIIKTYKYKIPLFRECLNSIITLEYLFELGFNPFQENIDNIFLYGNFEVAKYLYAKKCKPSKDILSGFFLYIGFTPIYNEDKNFEVFQFLVKKNYILPKYAIEYICANKFLLTIPNHIQLIKYLVKKGYPLTDRCLYNGFKSNNLPLVKYLYKKGCRIKISILNQYVDDTNKDIFQFLRSKECKQTSKKKK